jgi:hypothetical protein
VFLELAKFASLLLSLLSLVALLRTAFFTPASNCEQRILPALGMLLLAAAVCMGSGAIFRAWEQRVGQRQASVVTSLPMLIFWWSAGAITLLYVVTWFLERFFIPIAH